MHSTNKIDFEGKGKVIKELIKIKGNPDFQNLISSLINNLIRIKTGHLVNINLIILTKIEVIHHNKIQELPKDLDINIKRKPHNNKCKII